MDTPKLYLYWHKDSITDIDIENKKNKGHVFFLL